MILANQIAIMEAIMAVVGLRQELLDRIKATRAFLERTSPVRDLGEVPL